MKQKLHLYTIILAIGLFLLPNLNYACGVSVEKVCCTKEVSSEKTDKDCCKNRPSDSKDKSCGGKCGHSNCTSTAVSYSLLLVNEFEFKNSNFNFSDKKQKFYHTEAFISSGFSSIWQPPKIQ